MPNNPEMTKFLYTIVKQLDLKSVDWTRVSTELGITNGHAARMRYSRFRQQMEGNTPIRRVRVPNAKRPPKQKRSKDENKALGNIKLEDSLSMVDHMPSSSPSVANFDSSQGSNTPILPEVSLVKSEPRDDPESPETPLALINAEYNSPHVPLQSINPEHQTLQQGPVLTGPSTTENVPDFTFDTTNSQIQHHQRLFQMMPQVHAMMGQNMNDNMIMADQREFGYIDMSMYNAMNDVGCQNHMIAPMVKVEERWDPSYVQ